MAKQLELFPELAKKLVCTLDLEAEIYSKEHFTPEVNEKDLAEAYKEGASMVFGEIIDILKKYTDLHEA